MTSARRPPGLVAQLRALSVDQRHTLVACLLGWSLDAFDFFILVFGVKSIAEDFRTDVTAVTLAITLTLAMRPVGALLFGWAADRYGRHPTLMVNIVAYSILELASAGAPSLPVLIGLRSLYGIAMGGEWGVGAALALESAPLESRGAISGILQQGYPLGYLLASILFGVFFSWIGWRGMFVVGALPAGVVLYLRAKVPESPTWKKDATKPGDLRRALRAHFPRFLYLVVLMAAFNFFSHGTQDVYPLFLQKQRGLDPHEVGAVAVTYNLGAILGGLAFGTLSERFGRRRTIACAALLALPVIPLWVLAHSAVWLAVGAFAIQVMVQGAWGIVPAHLNELSPGSVRGTFPGLAYQLGNLVAAATATIETAIAASSGGNYALALGGMTAVVAVFLAVAAALGPEAKGVRFDAPGPTGST
ncbi:MAG TPA: MFS transporter [Polyangiaceae bacterium]|jgi:SHS family lactate transporter-like MFS transporter